MFRKVNRESPVVEETASAVEVAPLVSVEDFCAAERAAVEQAEAELQTALDGRGRLTHEMEAERERQLRETFDGDRLVEFEKRIAVAGKAIERARHRLAIANERLREKGAEHRRLLEAHYRALAAEAVDHLHRKLLWRASGSPSGPSTCTGAPRGHWAPGSARFRAASGLPGFSMPGTGATAVLSPVGVGMRTADSETRSSRVAGRTELGGVAECVHLRVSRREVHERMADSRRHGRPEVDRTRWNDSRQVVRRHEG
jgi:hypothetical protein